MVRGLAKISLVLRGLEGYTEDKAEPAQEKSERSPVNCSYLAEYKA